MKDSVDYINTLLRESNAPMECEFSLNKGRVLKAVLNAAQGETIFSGPPLHRVAEDLKNPAYVEMIRLFEVSSDRHALDYGAMWYWCGLNSLDYSIGANFLRITSDAKKQLCLLYHPELAQVSSTMRMVAKVIGPYLTAPLTDAQLYEIETMTIIWTLNCFEYSEDPLTYASYFLPSFMSHSCGPSAMWTTQGDIFEIRAQKDVCAGDELTVSYLTEEFCLRPKEQRIKYLESTKFFLCDCWRCRSDSDDTRGFRLNRADNRLENVPCYVRFPVWDKCAGCGEDHSLDQSAIESLLNLEHRVVSLVNYYDSQYGDELSPTITDYEKIASDTDAFELERLIEELGPFHWASMRGLLQLAQYHKWLGRYSKAIKLFQQHVFVKKNFVKFCDCRVSSSVGWALEELGDVLMLEVSNAVASGLRSEEQRELFGSKWVPVHAEDLERLRASRVENVYFESWNILKIVFGCQHEHATSVKDKLDRVTRLLRTTLA